MRPTQRCARKTAPGALALLVALTLAGCGSDDSSGSAGVPAAGPDAPTSTRTPGVPVGAPYDLDGRGWEKLTQAGRFEAAQAYIDDNPERCEGARAADVAFYVTNSYGLDFPSDIAAVEVLAEGCDADRQS